MKKILGLIIGLVVFIVVLSVALTLGLFVLLAVSIYFGVKYYQAYRKDKSSVGPIYKQWWLYTGVISLLFMFASLGSGSTENVKPTKLAVNEAFVTNDKGVATISGKTSPEYDVNIDNLKQTAADSDGNFSFKYKLKDANKKSLRLEVEKNFDNKTKKSKTIYVKPSDSFVAAESSSIAASTSQNTIKASQSSQAAAESSEKASTPVEYTSALIKATSYAKVMHMSKQGIYEQLTSSAGEGFSAEAAQYAIDNVKADWNANALAKAKNYQEQMAMSPAAIQEQLTSSAGEKFTPEEAQYAINNLNK